MLTYYEPIQKAEPIQITSITQSMQPLKPNWQEILQDVIWKLLGLTVAQPHNNKQLIVLELANVMSWKM